MKLSKTVLQWIRYARIDLNVAKASLEISSNYKHAAAFHAQQSAEKIVKAYLTFKKVRTPKTHDMEFLLKEISKIDILLAKKLSKAETLTIYAVTYRYPDAERKPLTVAKTKTAIKIAEQAFEDCLKSIKK